MLKLVWLLFVIPSTLEAERMDRGLAWATKCLGAMNFDQLLNWLGWHMPFGMLRRTAISLRPVWTKVMPSLSWIWGMKKDIKATKHGKHEVGIGEMSIVN